MRRPSLVLLACSLAATVAAAPAATSDRAAPAGASLEDGTFPIGVCVWARPVSPDDVCVIVNDPRPWLP